MSLPRRLALWLGFGLFVPVIAAPAGRDRRRHVRHPAAVVAGDHRREDRVRLRRRRLGGQCRWHRRPAADLASRAKSRTLISLPMASTSPSPPATTATSTSTWSRWKGASRNA